MPEVSDALRREHSEGKLAVDDELVDEVATPVSRRALTRAMSVEEEEHSNSNGGLSSAETSPSSDRYNSDNDAPTVEEDIEEKDTAVRACSEAESPQVSSLRDLACCDKRGAAC